MWAERQGLELAADCHLARIMQAAHLLQVSFTLECLISVIEVSVLSRPFSTLSVCYTFLSTFIDLNIYLAQIYIIAQPNDVSQEF